MSSGEDNVISCCQGLIDDVKLPVEPVLELEAGEAMFLDNEDQPAPPVKQPKAQPKQLLTEHEEQSQDQQQDKRDLKIKRTVVS